MNGLSVRAVLFTVSILLFVLPGTMLPEQVLQHVKLCKNNLSPCDTFYSTKSKDKGV